MHGHGWGFGAPSGGSDRTAVLWAIQSWGLVLLTFLSFIPLMFNEGEDGFIVLLVLAVGSAWLDRRDIWVRTPIDLPLVLFVAWILISVPFAVDPAYSFAEWRKVLASVLVFYWALLVLQVQSNTTIYFAILGAVVSGIIVQCSYSLIDFVIQGGSWKNRGIRATTPLGGFQELTTYMVITIPLLFVAVAVFQVRWQRIMSCGAVGLALLAQFFSYTRAGWLGMLAQVIGFGMYTQNKRIKVLLLAGVLVGFLSLFVISQLGYHQETFDPWTLNMRLAVWELAVEEMLKQPIFGMGFGIETFEPFIQDLEHGGGPMHLHNTFLMVGVGSGFPALILLVWILVAAIRTLLKQAAKVSDLLPYGIMVAVAIMILGFGVRNIFDYMFKGSLAYLFWILLATALAICIKVRKTASN